MGSFVTIQNSLGAGEITPSLYGRTDIEKWHHGCSTLRNFFVDYRGGATSRPGFAYVGTCKQAGYRPPPRDIPFQFNINQGSVLEFGDFYIRFKQNGAYVTEAQVGITSISTAAVITTGAPHGFNVGDWVFIRGESFFGNLTWIVTTVPSSNTFTVSSLFGIPITTSIAIGPGGSAARIYTIASPYIAEDLPYLKYTQSADTLSLTCINPVTGNEHVPYDLERFGATNWVLSPLTFQSTIQPPGNVAATSQASTALSTYYSYVVTAISATTGEESVASAACYTQNNDISVYAGSNTITWDPVAGTSAYNIYATTPSYNQQVPVGVLYGYMGTSLGTSFVDSNITPDFTLVPPTHQNPFARGQIIGLTLGAGGHDYTQTTVSYVISSATGSGFSGIPIVQSGAVVGFLIQNAGEGYQSGDSIGITDSGIGVGAYFTLVFGPQSGTYPGTVTYYQQRRVYGSTFNNPDTYWMSQPGNYLNFDSSIPTTDSDSISGTPWAQQVNGIQFMVAMPGGLVILTGKGAWQVNGGAQAAITPSNQVATPQAYNGCHDHVPPIVVNYDILYVQAKGSIVRDLSYNFFVNIYTGTDLTVLSNHLFNFHQIEQWTWAEEPFKIVWAIRDDGILLSLTYLKEQEVYAWARHDTRGFFVSIASVIEPTPSGSTVDLPALTDAVYVVTKRYIPYYGVNMYYSERLNNRIWNDIEDAFCVDSGLMAPVTLPNATLFIGSSVGSNISFSTNSAVFSPFMVGNVIRAGGGKATITAYTSTNSVLCTITEPILLTIPNDPTRTPLPATPGNWSIATPVSVVYNLNHLEGMEVAILADGSVLPNQIVLDGQINLQYPASQIVIGLPYVCQAQTLYLDHPGSASQGTVQNRRKNISAVGLRVEQTRGLQLGVDQPDASVQQDYADIPWTNLIEIKERTNLVTAGNAIPLFTGDYYQAVTSSWSIKGQVAIQQPFPLPATILSVITYWTLGDDK